MEKELKVEGVMYLPPNTLIKNPVVRIGPKGVLFREGPTPAVSPTHRGVLIPSLCNCHAHTDFAHPLLADGFIPWVLKIVKTPQQARRYRSLSERFLKGSMELGIYQIFDITRDPESPFDTKRLVPFLELIARENAPIPSIRDDYHISPHAPHSTTPELLKAVAERFKNRMIAIHTAESEQEIRFIRGEPNEIEDVLYPAVGRDKRPVGRFESPVVYLKSVGLLAKNVILVHCCFIDRRDIELIKRAGATVCVCPRSNLFLSGRIAPVKELMEEGVNVVLGTDSLASSPNWNLWEEARTLFLHLKLRPRSILAMMTRNPRLIPFRPASDALLLLDIPATRSADDLAFNILYQGDISITESFELPSSPPLW